MSETAREIIEQMPNFLQPAEAGDLKADIQFKFTGLEPGNYFVHVEGGKSTFNEGLSANPRTTLNCKSEVWQAIIGGTMDAFQAFMKGNLKVEGDMTIALRLQKIFKV